MGNILSNKYTSFNLVRAVKNNDLKSLIELVEEACPCNEDACAECLKSDNVECLRILVDAGYPCPENTEEYLAAYNSVKCAKLLNERRMVIFETRHYSATKLEFIRFLHEDADCPWNEDVIWHHVVSNSDKKIIEYLFTHGCPYHPDICSYALSDTTFDTLRFLHDKLGFEFTENTFAVAAAQCKTPILKYLYHSGCPCDERAYFNALDRERYDNIRYLLDIGCPMSKEFIFELLERLVD